MDEVIAARAERMRDVRDVVAGIDQAELHRVCAKSDPYDFSGYDMPVLHCFWRMMNEESEHHSFAVRDLETLDSR